MGVGEHRIPQRAGEERGGVIGSLHRSPVTSWANLAAAG